MDKSIKDSSIVEIEHLFNETIHSDDDSLSSKPSIASASDSNYYSVSDEIYISLNRLESFINHIETLKEISQSHIKQFKSVLKNLNDLYNYYIRSKHIDSFSNGEIKFVENLLVGRLNKLNDRFNFTDWNILFKNPKLESSQNEPLIKILSDYEFNEDLNKPRADVCRAKLRIRSIILEEIFINGDDNKKLLNTTDMNSSSHESDYLCSVYQFENNEFLISEHVKNQIYLTNQRQPRSKSQAKPVSSISKRSSSADLNSLKHRRSTKDKTDVRHEVADAEIKLEISHLNSTTRLNEKCVSIKSFKFKHTVEPNKLNQIINLEPECKYLIIIIYKLVKPMSNEPENLFKYPLKYIQLNQHHLKNISAPMLQNYKLPLSPIIENIVSRLPQVIDDITPSSNMFRRMFKRSKSTNRNRHGAPKEDNNSPEVNVKLPVRNLIDIDLTFEQRNLIDSDFSIENFSSWQRIWRPCFLEESKQNDTKSFETLTIYLNEIQTINETSQQKIENPNFHSYYFVEIHVDSEPKEKSSYFQSNLFKLSEKINDLCQISLDFDQTANIKVFLFKLSSKSENNKIPVQLASSHTFELSRKNLIAMTDLSLSPAPNSNDTCSCCFFKLKLKCHFHSQYYPTTSQLAVELLNFKLINKLEQEKELLHILDSFSKGADFNQPILIRKFLEFFAILNTALPADESSLGLKKNDRRMIRSLLCNQIYEAFIKVIEQCFYPENKMQTNKCNLNVVLSDFKQQSKQSIHFLLNFLKNQIDSLISDSNSALFILTIKTFHKLIEIIHILAFSNNKSKFELKYEMNDLIVKLFGSKSQNSSDSRRKSIIKSNLNFKFIDTISSLFSGPELASLIYNNFLYGNDNTVVLKLINEHIVKLEIFASNHQFRDALISQLLKNNNIVFLEPDKQLLGNEQIDLIMSLLKFRFKLNKQNVDNLVNGALVFLINSLIEEFKLIQNSKLPDAEDFIVKNFLSLLEILDIVLNDRVNKSIIENNKSELNNLIEIILHYFKCDKFRSNILNRQPRLWHKVNTIIIKFSQFTQKHLQRYLITFEEINDLNQKCANNPESIIVSTDQLIRNYIDMVFAFIDSPTVSFNLSTKMKFEMLQTLQLFYKGLNINLKRSNCLNELILKRLCNSLYANFYFKLIGLEIENNGVKDLLLLSPFISKPLSSQNYIYLFYENLFRFVSDLFVINQNLGFSSFKNFMLINLINCVIKREKVLRKSKNSVILKNQSKLIINQLESISAAIFFQSESQHTEMFHVVRLCNDLNILKDDSMVNNVSNVEKFLLIYELIKQVDKVTLNNKMFSNLQYLIETRRKIKMYLLDDLYNLHKAEKNHLCMSFVRKAQADLLEWNYSRKSSNESDLKEILYLKSLKKFAINTMHASSQSQSEAGTGSLSSSLSSCKASSVSSYMSSQSSISSDSSTTTSPSSSPSSSSSSPISTPSSLSLSASLKIDQTSIQHSYISNVQSEICKQLCAYYEKLDDTYPKYNRIMNAETKFLQIAAASAEVEKPSEVTDKNSNQHGHLYFRVGIFGSALKLNSISNKYYLYKHHSHEMLSNIQGYVMNKISSTFDWHEQALSITSQESDSSIVNKVVLLHHNQMPDSAIKQNANTCYLQICAVNKLEGYRLVDLIDEMIETKETCDIKTRLEQHDKNMLFYYFDRPFYMANSRSKMDHESVENLWIERSLLILDENSSKFENLTQYEEIKSIFKILLNPIRNAINDINEKTKELKNFVVQFTTNNSQQISQLNVMHNLQPLTMRLLGCLDARVNGGLIKYVKELVCQSLISSKQFKKKNHLMHELYLSIKNQLGVLESGLSIHNRILKNVQFTENKLDTENENIIENLKHMNQLNEHLIECLRLIEQELNDRWSKFSVNH